MTTTPSMETVCRTARIASTAAWSAPILSPRPTMRAAASAAASVVRTSSSARLRSGPVVCAMGPEPMDSGDALRDDEQRAERPRTLRGQPQVQAVALPEQLVDRAQRRLRLGERGLAVRDAVGERLGLGRRRQLA